MINTIFNNNYDLNMQYFNATGERYILVNEERQARFIRFYEERRQIGREIFRELESRGYHITNNRTLELFAGIYDSIGVEFNTHVVDRNISLLRSRYHNNLIRSSVENDTSFGSNSLSNHLIDNGTVNILNINVDIFNELTINGHFGERRSISFDLSEYNNFVLLNPRNHREEVVMRRLLNADYNSFIGYFGSNNDLDRQEHEEDIRRLQESSGAELITDLSLDNGYAYILTNNRI